MAIFITNCRSKDRYKLLNQFTLVKLNLLTIIDNFYLAFILPIFSYHSCYNLFINIKIKFTMEVNERVRDLQNKNSELNRNLKRLFYFSLGSISTLLCGLIYSNYQTFRKQRQIDDRDNLIERQKEQMKLLNSRADIMNQELAQQIKSIVKNLKNNVLDYSSKNFQESHLKTQINDAFHSINAALNNKIEAVKNYSYKQNLQRWYLANIVSTNVGINYNRLKKIELLEAKWLINDHKEKEKGFIWRRNGETQIKELEKDEQNQEFSTKLREYFGRKIEIQGKGISINLPNYITNYKDEKMRILIKYKCWGFDIKTGLFTVPLKAKDEKNILGHQITKIVKEGEENYLECSDKQWIRQE